MLIPMKEGRKGSEDIEESLQPDLMKKSMCHPTNQPTNLRSAKCKTCVPSKPKMQLVYHPAPARKAPEVHTLMLALYQTICPLYPGKKTPLNTSPSTPVP